MLSSVPKALTFAICTAAVVGCTPGVRVEIFNNSGSNAFVTSVFNDGSSSTLTVAPGDSTTLGPALTWHIQAGGIRSELQHPGVEFRAADWLGSELYRFQIEPSGCIFVLSTAQTAPVAGFSSQPVGYPIGPSQHCGG